MMADTEPGTPVASPITLSVRRLLGVNVSVCTGAGAVNELVRRLRNRQKTKVAFANANLLVELRRNNCCEVVSGFLMLNDGVAIDVASKILYGSTFPENLNGTDLIGKLLMELPKTAKVFLYGARPWVVEKAAAEIERQFGLQVCGYADGYSPPPGGFIDDIRRAGPDVLLVALGNPRQELWISKNADAVEAKLLIGVGAWFDFLTVEKRRAPLFVRRARLEWVYRLVREPGRLWRRYSVDILFFLFLTIDQLFTDPTYKADRRKQR